eukprot:m.342108 g.342108  ORF g.342108 m.342108 type:complete len:2570 (+) comp16120_c0_seq1:1158-8867(+)
MVVVAQRTSPSLVLQFVVNDNEAATVPVVTSVLTSLDSHVAIANDGTVLLCATHFSSGCTSYTASASGALQSAGTLALTAPILAVQASANAFVLLQEGNVTVVASTDLATATASAVLPSTFAPATMSRIVNSVMLLHDKASGARALLIVPSLILVSINTTAITPQASNIAYLAVAPTRTGTLTAAIVTTTRANTVQLMTIDTNGVLATDSLVSVQATAPIVSSPVVWYDTTTAETFVACPTGEDKASTIKRVYASDASSDITTTGGVIRLANGVTSASLYVDVQDDSTPELAERFTVVLESVSGGASLSRTAARNATVTIEPSDSPHGVVSVAQGSQMLTVSEADGDVAPVQITLKREFGTVGPVSVAWTVHNADGNISPPAGVASFVDAQASMVVVVDVLPDTVPEPAETFQFELVQVTSVNGDVDLTRSRSSIVVPANDDVHGVFGLSVDHQLTVEGSTVLVTVNRTVGFLGAVNVDLALAAKSAGMNVSVDLNAPMLTMHFPHGETSQSIPINVAVDGIPETDEDFSVSIASVSLQNRTTTDDPLSPRTNPAQETITVTVAANNNASGVFAITQTEVTAEEGTLLRLTVSRLQGLFGDVYVAFGVQAAPSPTVVPGEYTVLTASPLEFSAGQTTQSIEISIQNDTRPEVTEFFTVSLFNAIGGLPSSLPALQLSNASCVVSIPANDDVHGHFAIVSPLTVNLTEGQQTLVTVQRTVSFVGDVLVNLVSPSPDIMVFPESFVFPANLTGMDTFTATVTAIDDTIPELAETATIFLATDVSGARVVSSQDTVTVTIAPSDDANGVFALLPPFERTIEEPSAGDKNLNLTVVRSGGTADEVTVRWTLAPVCSAVDVACARTSPTLRDFAVGTVTTGLLDFSTGVEALNIPLTLINDNDPEGDETFAVTIAIEGVIEDGGVRQDATTVNFTVASNDLGNGLLSFAPSSLNVAVDEGNSVTLTVFRALGNFGQTTVQLELQPGTADDLDYAEPLSTLLTFEDGEITRTVTIDIADDTRAELAEFFTVALSQVVQGGAALAEEGTVATVTIRAGDNPYGVVAVAQPTITTDAQFTRTLNIQFDRSAGTFGNVVVQYTVSYVAPIAKPAQSAVLNNLCNPTCNATLLNGEPTATVSLQLPSQDVLLEVGDTFTVLVADVSLDVDSDSSGVGPVIDATARSASVEVTSSVANNAIHVDVASAVISEGNLFNISVSRNSVQGVLSASWTVRSLGSGADVDADLSVSSGTISTSGVFATVLVGATQDQSPELAEGFVFELSDIEVTGDVHVVRSDSVALTIEENDDARGVFRFELPSTAPATPLGEGEGINVTVLRTAGTFGAARVVFRVLDSLGDLLVNHPALASPFEYQLDFADGEASHAISIDVINDALPELQEEYSVELLSVSSLDDTASTVPRLVEPSTASFFVGLSDHPFGLVGFDSAGSASGADDVVSESDGQVTVALKRLGGTLGALQVYWEASTRGIIRSDTDGAQPTDFAPFTGTVTFQQGETARLLSITIADDDVAEPDEDIVLTITSVDVMYNGTEYDVVAVDSTRDVYTVRIEANDVYNGRIGFAAGQTTLRVTEAQVSPLELTVSRTGAAFGRVTVPWAISASADSTFTSNDITSPMSGVLVLEAAETSKTLSIAVAADGIPELAESFDVTLLDVQEGAVLVEETKSVSVVIEASDNPGGILAFDCLSRFGGGNADGASNDVVSLTIRRSAGTIGTAQVFVETEAPASAAGLFTPIAEIVTFGPGVSSTTIQLRTSALANSPSTTISLVLSNPVNAVLSDQGERATVTIYATEVEKQFLDAIVGNTCGDRVTGGGGVTLGSVTTPEDGFGPSVLASIISSLTELVSDSHTKNQTVHTRIRDLFKIALTPNFFSSTVVNFSPLPELMDLYLAELVLRSASSCPSTVDLAINVFLEGAGETNSLELLSSKLFATGSGGNTVTSVQLPEVLDDGSGSFDISACDSVTVAFFNSTTWFNARDAYVHDDNGVGRTVLTPLTVPGQVVSLVLPAGVDSGTVSFTNPVRYTIDTRAFADDAAVQQFICAWWDASLGDGGMWSDSGCRLIESDDERDSGTSSDASATLNPTSVQCECSHATAFTALVESHPVGLHPPVFRVTFVLMAFFLFVIIFTFGCRTISPSTALLWHLLMCLFVLMALLAANAFNAADLSPLGCSILGIVCTFFLAASFFLIVSYYRFSTLVAFEQRDVLHNQTTYILAPYIASAVLVALYLVVDQTVYAEQFEDSSFGAVTVARSFCLMPKTQLGGWLGMVCAPALIALVHLVWVTAAEQDDIPEWGRHDDIYTGRQNIQERYITGGLVGLLYLFWLLIAVCVLVSVTVPQYFALVVAFVFGVLLLLYYLQSPSTSGSAKIVSTGFEMTGMATAPRTTRNLAYASTTGSTSMISPPPGFAGQGQRMSTHHSVSGRPMFGAAESATIDFSESDRSSVKRMPDGTDMDDDDFDDLIFALQTGNTGHLAPTPIAGSGIGGGDGDVSSLHLHSTGIQQTPRSPVGRANGSVMPLGTSALDSSVDVDDDPEFRDSRLFFRRHQSQDHFELRRMSIADTHL